MRVVTKKHFITYHFCDLSHSESFSLCVSDIPLHRNLILRNSKAVALTVPFEVLSPVDTSTNNHESPFVVLPCGFGRLTPGISCRIRRCPRALRQLLPHDRRRRKLILDPAHDQFCHRRRQCDLRQPPRPHRHGIVSGFILRREFIRYSSHLLLSSGSSNE